MPFTMPSERVQRQIDRLLDQVEEAVNRDAWDEVTEKASRVLDVDPDNSDALAFSARAGGDAAGENSNRGDGSSPPTAESDTPTSFADGRYEVTGFLGEGGKKKVYLVHDTTLDRDVAFALIKAEGLDAASRQRVTR